MEPIRIAPDEFKFNNFINYYKDNSEELLFDYPKEISRITLIDKDYMDVVTFDEDYEDIQESSDYESILLNGEYALHFVIGKTDESLESVEFIDGKTKSLKNYVDDIYEESTVKDIGDLNIDLDHLIGLLVDYDDEEKDIVISVVSFEHGGEISNPRIIEVEDCGDLENSITKIISNFI